MFAEKCAADHEDRKPVFETGKENGLLRLRLLILASVAVLCMAFPVHAKKGVYEWASVRLDYARDEKVRQLLHFCDRIHSLAQKAAADASVISFFDVNRQYADALNKGPVPDALTERVLELREEFNHYYLENYLSFYDLLFVNLQGDVFYTIRKEADLNRNLLRDDPQKSPLARCLRTKPRGEAFVDFHDYGPTSKPAAFFVEPVRSQKARIGWIVLQCNIGKVNTIFAWNEDLGQTGETFLVNQEGFMLTESNFVGDSTILKKRLDDRNIQAKFSEGRGHRTVTDYRGCRALTSFEVVRFMGAKWLVVAKKDRDEIITRHYSQYQRYYAEKLLAHLEQAPVQLRKSSDFSDHDGLRVDMDEFVKASKGETLQTFGISTCTGILVAYPGKFAYLAHISTRDKLYGSDQTNLLGQVVKQVQSFDIRPCEKNRVLFVFVAPHLDSLLAGVAKLVAEGILLTQIQVMLHPQAESAAMRYSYRDNDLAVAWRLSPFSGKNGQRFEDGYNVGEIIQQFVQSEEAQP